MSIPQIPLHYYTKTYASLHVIIKKYSENMIVPWIAFIKYAAHFLPDALTTIAIFWRAVCSSPFLHQTSFLTLKITNTSNCPCLPGHGGACDDNTAKQCLGLIRHSNFISCSLQWIGNVVEKQSPILVQRMNIKTLICNVILVSIYLFWGSSILSLCDFQYPMLNSVPILGSRQQGQQQLVHSANVSECSSFLW